MAYPLKEIHVNNKITTSTLKATIFIITVNLVVVNSLKQTQLGNGRISGWTIYTKRKKEGGTQNRHLLQTVHLVKCMDFSWKLTCVRRYPAFSQIPNKGEGTAQLVYWLFLKLLILQSFNYFLSLLANLQVAHTPCWGDLRLYWPTPLMGSKCLYYYVS